ncbi:hypothetical protein SSPIM334S_04106 [Streptomyces spiroverticillatus]
MNPRNDGLNNLITVVIAAHNAAPTVGRALKSILHQTHEALDVVVVDDASTDSTLAVAQGFAAGDSRVRVLARPHNSGGCGAPRNDGVAAARGDYVMFVDADDELPHQACALLLEAASANGGDIIAGRVLRVNRDTGESKTWAPDVYVMDRNVSSLPAHPQLLNDPVAAGKLYRTAFLKQHGIKFPEGVFYEDTWFSTVAGCLADGITLTTGTVYRWMWEQEGTSITGRTGELRNIQDRVAVHRATDRFLLDHGHSALKARKDAKFLAHDLRLYMGALAEGDAAYRTGFAETVAPYLGGISDEAYDLCGPLDRVRAFFLLYGETEAALTTLDYAQRRSVLSSHLVQEDGRVYWSGDHLHLPAARRRLDVTELGLDKADMNRTPLFGRLLSWTLAGTELTFEGELVNRFGRISAGDRLSLRTAVRNRRTKEDDFAPARILSVDSRHIRFRSTVDLAEALGDATTGAVWNLGVRVDWNGQRCRSALLVRDTDLTPLRLTTGGVEVEGYRTVSGNLALRTADARSAGDFEISQRDPSAPWMWWQGRQAAPMGLPRETYDLAVVVPCYNVEQYLDDCLGSIAAQRDFDRVQVVLVDDGATDATPGMLDAFAARYANTTVLHQRNGGLGNARNNGLALVRAPFVTFLDSDDILGPDALSRMVHTARRDGSDVVIGDLVNFPARPYGPWKQYFGAGDRIIEDLSETPDLAFSGSACNKLFSTGLLRRLGLAFGEGVHFEDAWVTLPALLRARRVSILDTPVYYYRGRPDGSSIMDSLWSNPANYRDHLRLNLFLLDVAAAEAPEVRRVFQRYAVRTYKGFLGNMRNVMSRENVRQIFPDMHRHYRGIPDDVILEYATTPAQQLDHYALKSGNFELFWDPERVTGGVRPRVLIDNDGFYRSFGRRGDDCRVARIADPTVVVESITERDGSLLVEGSMSFPGMDLSDSMENRLEFVHQTRAAKVVVPLRQVHRRDIANARNGRDRCAGWYAEISPEEMARGGFQAGDFRLRVRHLNGKGQRNVVMKARLPLHRFKGPGRVGDHRYMVTIGNRDSLHFRLVDTTRRARVSQGLWRLRREVRILSKRAPGWRMRFAYWATRPLLRSRDIWLIGERSNTAQDNASHLFRWIRTNEKRRNAYYVIDGDSEHYGRIKKFGHVLKRGSFRHRMYLLHAKKVIGAYDSESYLIPPKYGKLLYLHRFGELIDYQRIFLQHGVTYNDVSVGAARQLTSYDMIVTSGRQETQYMAQALAYADRAQPTGFPRFDALVREPRQRPRILLMPTWRQWLVTASYKKSGAPSKTVFTQSEYFSFYRSLLTHPRLVAELEKHGVDLEFFPHYEILPYLHHFRIDSPSVKVADPGARDLQQAMKECSLMVTDYSSVFFDVAYMGIPLVHVPFDEEDFYGRHYRRGYFDLARDGFGPVARTVEAAVDEIIASIERGFTVESPYQERVQDFFVHRDQNNCARTYRAIEQLVSRAPEPVGVVPPPLSLVRAEEAMSAPLSIAWPDAA